MDSARCLHLDLDGAWPREALPGEPYLDARAWGPGLRYSTTREAIRDFEAFAARHPARFTLFGSGDYHHLSALWLRRLEKPFTLVSFDNHPDWDTRPPHWCCGTWINRALESDRLKQVAVWGCGNFEFEWPSRLFINRRAIAAGRLLARPWAERLKPKTRPRWPVIEPATWRDEFASFAATLAGRDIYITVDFDCLRAEESVTNWENGLFTAQDVVWAIGEIRRHAQIVAGDVCGAYSEPQYARFRQRIESWLDHPKRPSVSPEEARRHNLHSFEAIWPALTA